MVDQEAGVPSAPSVLLHDARTSGGLLLAAPPGRVAGLAERWARSDVDAAMIGRVKPGTAGRIQVRMDEQE